MRSILSVAVCLLMVACGDPDPKTGSVNNANNANNVNNVNNVNNANNVNNGGTRIDVTRFDQSCVMDTDCQIVGVSCCGCDFGAVSNDAVVDVNEAIAGLDCTLVDCPAIACEQPDVACGDEGVCRVRDRVEAQPEMFSNFCETADDCVNVAADPCEECNCGGLLISASETDAYNTWAETLNCNPGPNPCDCEATSVICSDANTCEFE